MPRKTCNGCPYLVIDRYSGGLATLCDLGQVYLEGYGAKPASFGKPQFCNGAWRRHRREKLGINASKEIWKK